MTDQNAAHELSITRLIEASPEIVYEVWTQRAGEWWAPRPYTTPVIDWDLRPGGRARTVMRSPDGTDMPHEGVFLEVVPHRKIVVTDAFKPGWIPQQAFMVAIFTFEPEGSGTRYTARVRHWSEEAVQQHEQMGFHEGWSIVAGQLAELAEGGPVASAA
ncbi:SRPBCC family protein [Microvirga mediterraneensis]|uniref:SRPBCC family protein n=1 Tax=Microvirga mediterraneensis TaxID=2754695 RepID=A0A838BLI4_9HYPH|nr:SRPBCC family protein [Microvirga mediterraneensis]MBA1155356.1 SRPBCC family protein [Microvirga mediterraneensis]